MSSPYAAHSPFVDPARHRPEAWRIIAVLLGAEFVFALTPEIIAAFLPNATSVTAFYMGDTTFWALAQFFAFAITAAGLLLLIKGLHKRGLRSLIGPTDPALIGLIQVVVAVAAVRLAIEIFPPWINPTEVTMAKNVGHWLVILPIALLALLIQTGTEELFYRGYLQQQFACLSKSPIVWMGGPSLLFGLGHYANGFGPADGVLYVIWATALGLACADLTGRTGNIGAAIGLHLSNNAFAVLIIGVKGWPTSGLALFLYPYEDPFSYDYSLSTLFNFSGLVELLTLLCMVAVMWLAARIGLRQ